MAAGLSIREMDLAQFRQAFEQVCSELLDADALIKSIATDGALQPAEFSLELARELQQQVWGQGFAEPLFEGDFDVESQRVVGEKHLKLKLKSAAGSVDAIYFFYNETVADTVHAVFSLSINEYNGKQTLQLIVRHCM